MRGGGFVGGLLEGLSERANENEFFDGVLAECMIEEGFKKSVNSSSASENDPIVFADAQDTFDKFTRSSSYIRAQHGHRKNIGPQIIETLCQGIFFGRRTSDDNFLPE